MRTVILFAFIVSCLCVTSLKVSLSNDFVTRSTAKLAQVASQGLVGLTFPEISQTVDVPVIGSFLMIILLNRRFNLN